MNNMWLIDILKKNKTVTFLAIFTKIIFSISIVLTSFYLSKLFDSYNLDREKFYQSIMIMIVILLLTVIFSYISDYFNSKYIKKTNLYTRKIIDQTIIAKSEELVSNKNTGKHLSWYINDVNELENKYFKNIVNIFYYGSLVLFSAISIVVMHWIMLVATVLLLIVSLIVPNFVSKYIYEAQKKLTETNEKYTENVRDNLESLNLFFLSNKLSYFNEKMFSFSRIKEDEYFKYNITNAKAGSIMMFISLISQIGLMIFALYISSLGYAKPGSVISIAALAGNLFNGVQALVSSITMTKSVQAIAEKYNYQTDPDEKINIDSVYTIELKNVSFSYDDKKIFTNFNYIFDKKKYALIGPSGSGKSTLLKLILGIEHPSNGEVKVNEKNLKDVNKFLYYKNIAYIGQDVYLMNDSIKNNILLGSDISDMEFKSIIKKTNLEELINSLPRKEESTITSNGQEISGGEKQRIAIARALVKNVDFIFIDESTSQLDRENRKELETMLINLENIGVIMISHNYDQETLMKFDSVINLLNV